MTLRGYRSNMFQAAAIAPGQPGTDSSTVAREPGLDLGMFVGGVIVGDQVYQNDVAIAERRSSRLHPGA